RASPWPSPGERFGRRPRPSVRAEVLRRGGGFRMKRGQKNWPLAAGVLSGLMILVGGVMPGEAHPGRRPAHVDRQALESQLGLTADQVQAIREVHGRHRPAIREAARALRDARRALRAAALNETDDAALAAQKAE